MGYSGLGTNILTASTSTAFSARIFPAEELLGSLMGLLSFVDSEGCDVIGWIPGVTSIDLGGSSVSIPSPAPRIVDGVRMHCMENKT